MLHSLVASGTEGPVEIYLLHYGDVSDESRDRTRESVEGFDAEVRFLPIPHASLADLPKGGYSPATWSRILIPEMLPDVHKLLYLDADMIVLSPLDALWATPLGEHHFAAVANAFYPWMGDRARELGLPAGYKYFNAGVLLMNLDAMRKDDAATKLRRYAFDHPRNQYPDQDALNAVYHDSVLHLHPRWNAQTTIFDVDAEDLPFPRAEALEAREDPAIVHYIGPYKPWHTLCTHPYRDAYFDHLDATPWPRTPLEGRTAFNRLVRPLGSKWIMRSVRARAALQRTGRRWYRGVKRRLPLGS